jgi:hypothetical protein
MSPAVCLGGSLRTAFELGAAWAVNAAAHITAVAKAHNMDERTKRDGVRLRLSVIECKEGMCERVMAKLSRLG